MSAGQFVCRPRQAILLLLFWGGTTCSCSGGQGTSSTGARSSNTDGADAGATAGGADAGATADGADAGATADGAASREVIPDFNGCISAAYVDQRASDASRTIGIATMGLSFTPKCLVVQVGQTVRWEGSLSTHPLAPGNPDQASAGSLNSPIVATSSGQSVDFTFPSPGTFPYYCQVHSFGNGKGMAGVVHVTP